MFAPSFCDWDSVLPVQGLALQAIECGPTAGYEVRSPGPRNTWLLRVGSLDRFGSLRDFASAMQAGGLLVAPGEHLALADPELSDVRFDWSGAFTVAGRDRRHDVRATEPEPTLDDGRMLDLRSIAGPHTGGL